MLKGISTKIVKRIVDTAARTVQVVANEGIGSAIKKIHLYNGIRPHAILKGVDEFGNKYYEDGEKAETVSRTLHRFTFSLTSFFTSLFHLILLPVLSSLTDTNHSQ